MPPPPPHEADGIADPLHPEMGERLLVKEVMSEFGQAVFRGVESLNPVQSRVFPAAYRTNQVSRECVNVCVCAAQVCVL